MKLIAIETSERLGSLLAVQQDSGDRELNLSVNLPADARSAQSLAPCLRELLTATGWRLEELDAVAVASGPGSFTGLRIGVTTAKMLAYAAGCGVVEVNTLEAIAAQAGFAGRPGSGVSGWAVMDAQRNELFAARSTPEGGSGETVLLTRDDWLSKLQPGEWVSGPVLDKLAEHLPKWVSPAPRESWAPRAQTVADLALPRALAGEAIPPEALLPRYFRLSAAEEKRLKQGEAGG